ncbi:hypothetical protein [Methylobacterium sp. ARG-1]|uniref:hypothetical protein n=1 Tax=Methylobacterium sp. ARG-1 TaxID=1692501 RepID=UPI000A69A76E|nr:hypothetical protein [Methylobacterium sp. ARG-1]
MIGAVNLSEVYGKLAEAGGTEAQIAQALGVLHLAVEPFDGEQARIAGTLRLPTRSIRLSLGDRSASLWQSNANRLP